MRAVLLEVPEQMLAERRELGLGKRDEMWDGVVHMVPPAGEVHQRSLAGDRSLPVSGDLEGSVRSDALRVSLASRATALELRWDGGSATV